MSRRDGKCKQSDLKCYAHSNKKYVLNCKSILNIFNIELYVINTQI